MKKTITILVGLLALISQAVFAEDYMLPKSFSTNSNLPMPKVEKKKPAAQAQPVSQKPTVVLEKLDVENEIKQTSEAVSTDISLVNLIKNYKYSYSQTLTATLSSLANFDITPIEYDSSKGQIIAELSTGKRIFILLLPSSENLTHVRITAADGRYNFSVKLINDLFDDIGRGFAEI